jgi:hypothetical protein
MAESGTGLENGLGGSTGAGSENDSADGGDTCRKRGCQGTHTAWRRQRGITSGHGRIGGRAMILDMSKARIFIRPGQTDLRKGVNGLTAIIQGTMKQEPLRTKRFITKKFHKK